MKSLTKYVLFFILGLLLLAGGFYIWVISAAAQINYGTWNPLFPAEMNAAEYSKTEYVIGDLGGVPVRIPHYFANHVSYHGDPGFGEKRKGPVPGRTYQSRLESFGFVVRMPDMAGRSSPEMWHDYQKYSDYYWKDYYDPIKSISPWIIIGINSGGIYPGDGFLEYLVNATLSFNAEKEGFHALAHRNYIQLSKKEYGLTVYAAPGINVKTNKPYRQDDYAEDLFVHRGKDGKVDTYITCSNRNLQNFKLSPCTQHISMEPGMRAEIYILHNRNWLPHWQEIQRNVSDLVWKFKVDQAISSTSINSVLPLAN